MQANHPHDAKVLRGHGQQADKQHLAHQVGSQSQCLNWWPVSNIPSHFLSPAVVVDGSTYMFCLQCSLKMFDISIFLNNLWHGVQVQGLQSAIEQMSPFRQRLQGHPSPRPAADATLCVLDPFNADLHKRLLAGLDPPVEQVGPVPLIIR